MNRWNDIEAPLHILEIILTKFGMSARFTERDTSHEDRLPYVECSLYIKSTIENGTLSNNFKAFTAFIHIHIHIRTYLLILFSQFLIWTNAVFR